MNRSGEAWYLGCLCGLLLCAMATAYAEEGEDENASNTLAKVKNTDFRWQYLDLKGSERNDFFIDGAFMAADRLKAPGVRRNTLRAAFKVIQCVIWSRRTCGLLYGCVCE